MYSGHDPIGGEFEILVADAVEEQAIDLLERLFGGEEFHGEDPVAEQLPLEEFDDDLIAEVDPNERSNAVKLILLSLMSSLLTPALFSLPYYSRLSARHRPAKIAAALFTALGVSVSTMAMIRAFWSYEIDMLIAFSIIMGILLSTIKSISMFRRGRSGLAYAMLVPLAAAAILIVVASITT